MLARAAEYEQRGWRPPLSPRCSAESLRLAGIVSVHLPTDRSPRGFERILFSHPWRAAQYPAGGGCSGSDERRRADRPIRARLDVRGSLIRRGRSNFEGRGGHAASAGYHATFDEYQQHAAAMAPEYDRRIQRERVWRLRTATPSPCRLLFRVPAASVFAVDYQYAYHVAGVRLPTGGNDSCASDAA